MQQNKVLVIGNGGREHAIAWKLASSPLVAEIFVAPGNAGTANESKVRNLPIDALSIAELIAFAKQESIDLTIVGPEAPLAHGIIDAFTQAGLTCLGPTKAAAQLESSKAYAKAFMQRHNIPTALYQQFNETHAALSYLDQVGVPIVIKADGLAAGKAVVVAHTMHEATSAIKAMLDENQFGAAGHTIILEEYLTGIEVSFIVLTDGTTVIPLASSQDHKTRDDGNMGPNTGGMGAISPAPIMDDSLFQHIMTRVIHPAITGTKNEGHEYVGFLYAGLIITPMGEVKVLEFNCRFGDPETQPILMRLQSDFFTCCFKAATKQLNQIHLNWDPKPAVGVVMASRGYPADYPISESISGLDKLSPAFVKVFHSGTKMLDQEIVTNGGRVLCVTALGDSLTDARNHAYRRLAQIDWPHAFYRKDIGLQACKK